MGRKVALGTCSTDFLLLWEGFRLFSSSNDAVAYHLSQIEVVQEELVVIASCKVHEDSILPHHGQAPSLTVTVASDLDELFWGSWIAHYTLQLEDRAPRCTDEELIVQVVNGTWRCINCVSQEWLKLSACMLEDSDRFVSASRDD